MMFTVNQTKVPARGRRHLALCLVLLALCAAAGCGSRKEASAPAGPQTSGAVSNAPVPLIVGPNAKTFDEMQPEDVLVSVNGVGLKRAECDALLDRMAQTYQSAHPNAPKNEVLSFRRVRARSLASEYVVKQLLLQEAQRRGLVATPENKAKADELLAKRAKFEKKTPDEYLRSIGAQEAAAVRADLNDQALILTLRQTEFGDRLKITDADLQAARERIARYNSMCDATNALVKARGASLSERLRKEGEDFVKVADEVTETEDGSGGMWGEFTRGEIDDAAVRHAAFTLPVGAVSDPIDTEEGLVIIKVLERTGLDSPVAASAARVKLGRIVLRLGESKTVPDEATLRKELERERLEELQGGWLQNLRRQARVEYPNGTNFWKKASKK